MKLNQFQKKLKENVENIYNIAKDNNWIFKYDEDSDILYMTNFEKGFNKESINYPLDCGYFSIQINKKADIEGIIIEDFINLFVPENKEYKEFAQNILKKKKAVIKDDANKSDFKSIVFDIMKKHLCPAYSPI